jgi:hypothetical protein
MNTHIYGADAYKIICSCGIQTISKVPGRDGTAVECVMALLALWNSHIGVTLDHLKTIDCTASEEV